MKIRVYAVLTVIMSLNFQVMKAQKTVKIGNQVWMAENLNVKVKGSTVYNEDPVFQEKYGRLYTWAAAQNACPPGWHLPSDGEWTELINTLGGEDVAGKKLKLNGGTGFNALLAGYSNVTSFWFNEVYGGFWSSTSYDDGHAWYQFITKKDDSFTKSYYSKIYGYSVRCIKD
jgi:uncharacterized protein (TIGR02145 family)